MQQNVNGSQPVKPKQIMRTKALVLDLDGTVRQSKSGAIFIQNSKDVEIIPGVEKKIWEYRDKGYMILGVSNQGGVAHGFKTPNGASLEMQATVEGFKKNPFHNIKMCFQDETGNVLPYNIRSLCRKPGYGMLAAIELEAWHFGYVIDWDQSIFVGDREEDRLCAEAAGIPFQWAKDFFPPDIQIVKGNFNNNG